MKTTKRQLIYRDEALRELEKRCDAAERLRAEAETEERRSRLEDIEMAFIEAGMTLKDLQAVEERPRGRWKRHPNEREYDICTNCRTGVKRREYGLNADGGEWVTEASYRYCPYCGARMDAEEEE